MLDVWKFIFEPILVVISYLVNLAAFTRMAYVAIRQFQVRRDLRLLWGNQRSPGARVSFSQIDIDDPARFRSKGLVTNVGDAQAVILVTNLFKRSLDRDSHVVADQTLDANVDMVLIGGPLFNKATKEVLEAARRRYALPHDFGRDSDGFHYIDDKPAQATRRQTIRDRQVRKDFAIVARFPHPLSAESRQCVVLAGLSTFGTLAAATFALDPNHLRQLFRRYPEIRSKPFTALVTAEVNSGQTGIIQSTLQLLNAGTLEVRG